MTKGKKHIIIVSRSCKCITNRLMFNAVSQVQVCTAFLDGIASWIFEAWGLGAPFTFIEWDKGGEEGIWSYRPLTIVRAAGVSWANRSSSRWSKKKLSREVEKLRALLGHFVFSSSLTVDLLENSLRPSWPFLCLGLGLHYVNIAIFPNFLAPTSNCVIFSSLLTPQLPSLRSSKHLKVWTWCMDPHPAQSPSHCLHSSQPGLLPYLYALCSGLAGSSLPVPRCLLSLYLNISSSVLFSFQRSLLQPSQLFQTRLASPTTPRHL